MTACEGDAASSDYSGILHFDSSRVTILAPNDSISLLVEIARTPEQRAHGLMERLFLPDSAGMLFVYSSDQPATAGFWMFRTRIPLDIAFLDSAGHVVAVRRMEPCAARLAAGCPSYEPGQPYRAALEVNAGFLERHGIGRGTRVLMPSVVAQ